MGNISKAFIDFPDIQFTGLDIDPVVINYASKLFNTEPTFNFICYKYQTFVKYYQQELFDYMLFAGAFHYIDNHNCQELLTIASKNLNKEGKGHIAEVGSLAPKSKISWFVRQYFKIELGRYIHSGNQILTVV